MFHKRIALLMATVLTVAACITACGKEQESAPQLDLEKIPLEQETEPEEDHSRSCDDSP